MLKIIDLRTMTQVGSFPEGTAEQWRDYYLKDLGYDYAEIDHEGDLVIEENE